MKTMKRPFESAGEEKQDGKDERKKQEKEDGRDTRKKRRRGRSRCPCPCGDPAKLMNLVADDDQEEFVWQCRCIECGPQANDGKTVARRCTILMSLPFHLCEDCRRHAKCSWTHNFLQDVSSHGSTGVS